MGSCPRLQRALIDELPVAKLPCDRLGSGDLLGKIITPAQLYPAEGREGFRR